MTFGIVIKTELFLLKCIFLLFGIHALSSSSWSISSVYSVSINSSLLQTKISSGVFVGQSNECLYIDPHTSQG